MFIAVIFTMTKTQKKFKYPLTDELKKGYICKKMECSLVIKIEIMSLAQGWMNLQTIMLSRVSQIEKEKIYDITYLWNLKIYIYKWIYIQNRNTLTVIDNKLRVTKGEGRGEG